MRSQESGHALSRLQSSVGSQVVYIGDVLISQPLNVYVPKPSSCIEEIKRLVCVT